MENQDFKRLPVEVLRFPESSFLHTNHFVRDFNIYTITRSIA